MPRTLYEIRVAGVVPEQDLQDLGVVTVTSGQVHTVLYGVPDESALYGLLDRLRAQGIEVTEVRLVPDLSTAAPSEAGDTPLAGDGEEADDEQ